MSEAFRRRNNIIKMKNNASSASSWANMLKNAINSNSSKELIGVRCMFVLVSEMNGKV